MTNRNTGIDLARAFALFGMIIVNFKVAMSATTGSPILLSFTSIFEGRASALFVILAGLSISYLSSKTSTEKVLNQNTLFDSARMPIVKRGCLLFVIGLIYTPIWPADILHFYGCYFLLAAAFLKCRSKTLIRLSSLLIMTFPCLLLLFDYQSNWDFETFTYINLWSLEGMIKHLFFNGFHPIFPWAGFLFIGMWLGRLNLADSSLIKRLAFVAGSVFVVTELGFFLLRQGLTASSYFDVSEDFVQFYLSTSIMPPMPQYMVSAASSSVLLLLLSIKIAERYKTSKAVVWLAQTGKLSLTWYVGHVIIGMGFLEEIGRLNHQTIDFSLASAAMFCALSVVFTTLWLKRYKQGPLEWLFRKLAG